MNKKFLALLTAALLLAGLTGCGAAGNTSAEQEKPSGTAVEVQKVELGDIATENTVTGSVTANRSVPVVTKVACKVQSVSVKAGDTVKAGDVLFTLDTFDLRDTYGTALDTYRSTKTLLDEQVRQAQESLDNLSALYEIGAVSKNTVEQTRLGLLQAQNARKSTLAQMKLTDVLELMNNPRITAPIAGTISNVGVTAGVTIAPGSPAAVVSEIGRPQVVVNLSETLQPYVRAGSSVEISIPSLGDQVISGTVASVASAASPATALYEVHIDLPGSLNVSIGMFAKATFRTDAHSGAVLVPTEAILTGDNEARYVYIEDGGKAYRADVTTGLVGEKKTEITSGLHGGEMLVTRGQSYLSDGAPVRVTEG
ncbi:MAG: efflux RND transporter periplasmic adaptor subunit [Oscillibacter sp.]|jgi:RND family efflux transporter MFP subunit|nr:efflux RND transporter periplasmic adaptor subunit [Oscillibacter sp.]